MFRPYVFNLQYFAQSILYGIINSIDNENESLAPVSNETPYDWICRIKHSLCHFGVRWAFDKQQLLHHAKIVKKQGMWNKDCAIVLGSILKLMKRYKSFDADVSVDKKHTFNHGIRLEKVTLVNNEDEDNVYIPLMTVTRHLNRIYVRSVAIGGSHYLFLLENGTLVGKGNNRFGQIGDDIIGHFFEYDASYFQTPIEQIVCGHSTSYVVCKHKSYARGCNENGRLGIGSKQSLINVWAEILVDNLVKIQAGSLFACGMDKDHYLYAWGSKYYTGTLSDVDNTIPIRVPVGKIYNFSLQLGGYHCVFLSFDGYAYGFGHNRVGQLGCPDNMTDEHHIIRLPQKLPFERFEVLKILAGWGNTVIVDSNHQIKIAGRNCSGQLGIPTRETPTNFKDVHCSPHFYTLCSTENVEYITMLQEGIAVVKKEKSIIWGNTCTSHELKRQNTLPHLPMEIENKLIGVYNTFCERSHVNTIMFERSDPH